MNTGDIRLLATLLSRAAVNYDMAAELHPSPNHKDYLKRAAEYYGRAMAMTKSQEDFAEMLGASPLEKPNDDSEGVGRHSAADVGGRRRGVSSGSAASGEAT